MRIGDRWSVCAMQSMCECGVVGIWFLVFGFWFLVFGLCVVAVCGGQEVWFLGCVWWLVYVVVGTVFGLCVRGGCVC